MQRTFRVSKNFRNPLCLLVLKKLKKEINKEPNEGLLPILCYPSKKKGTLKTFSTPVDL